ncbi:hypothetical protein JOL62DRAFT_510116 [Phyllosticta paracitricarpa]|uniref:C2H2-type domain-containing protein n=1 Tax=Phyllosticta paracitricarpa TaxID=2016321 RepID=A0ABR1MW16_9PEZI
MAHNQTYFGAHSQQSAAQPYSNYQQRSATNSGGQYPSQAQPASESYSSYTAPTYASSSSYNYPPEYYGATGYGTGNSSTGAVRNTGSTDLQQLAYASGLHNANQRSTAQSPVTSSQKAASVAHSYDHTRTYSNNSNTSFGTGFGTQQARPKSVNSLAGRTQQRSPALNSRNLQSPNATGLNQTPTFANASPTPKPVAQPAPLSSTPQLPSATHAVSHPQVHTVAPANTPDYSSRQLPNIAQVTQTGTSAASYQWTGGQQSQTTAADQRGFETVDPTQIYDPWPEIQRKREALRAAKELEERAQRQEEERRQAEERRQVEDRRQAEQQRQQEEHLLAVAAQQQAAQSTAKAKKRANTKSKMSRAADNPTPLSAAEGDTEDTEAQIRELMAKMRVLNSKDPTTLARIWEEERRTQSPRPQNQPQAQPARQTATPAAPTNRPPPPTDHPQQAPTPRQPSGPAVSHAPKPPQPQMKPPPPSGNTMWPADKKDQISKAASNWLNAMPENADKQVTPEEICTLLNRNPKYIELCQWLESTGLKLERASFARSLLSAVPDINQASTRAQPPVATQANGVVNSPPTIDLTQKQTQPSYPPPEATQHSSPYFAAAEKPTSTQPILPKPPPQIPVARMPHTRHESGSRQGSGSRETSQKPATKAEAARKRDFSEIIDLTALDDDDDDDEDLPPAKKQDNGPHEDITPTWALPSSVVNPSQPTPASYSAHVATPVASAVEDRTRNMDVVRSIEKKNALRRSSYDVRTIARDVLLATGKHPEMRPLNGHLDILKESFKNVDNNSDLSTIRWDLIDPGDPPADALDANVIEIDDDDADEEDEESPQQQKVCPPPKIPSNATPEHRPGALQEILPKPDVVSSNATPDPWLAVAKKRGPGRPRTGTPKFSATARNSSFPSLGGYSAFRRQELNPDGTPAPKKKGRPVGWRKAIHSKEAQARAAGLTPEELAALQRNAKAPAGGVSRASSVASRRTAPYSVFKCQWEGCVAELHNMETLRKHVFKFHQAVNQHKKFPCFWEGCSENHLSVNPRTGKPNGFSVPEDFVDHVEFAHLGPTSWELGDGQAGGLSESQDSNSEAYLYDPKTGRQVTPKIVPRKRDAFGGFVISDPAVKPKDSLRKDEADMTIAEKVAEAQRRFVQRREQQGDHSD